MQIFRHNISSEIKGAYKEDLLAKELRRTQLDIDILVFKGKTYLPYKTIEKVIKEYYNDLLQGHLGVTKTTEIIEKAYARPKLREGVAEYIKKCVLCQ